MPSEPQSDIGRAIVEAANDITVTGDVYVIPQQMAFYGYGQGAYDNRTYLATIPSVISTPSNVRNASEIKQDMHNRINAEDSVKIDNAIAINARIDTFIANKPYLKAETYLLSSGLQVTVFYGTDPVAGTKEVSFAATGIDPTDVQGPADLESTFIYAMTSYNPQSADAQQFMQAWAAGHPEYQSSNTVYNLYAHSLGTLLPRDLPSTAPNGQAWGLVVAFSPVPLTPRLALANVSLAAAAVDYGAQIIASLTSSNGDDTIGFRTRGDPLGALGIDAFKRIKTVDADGYEYDISNLLKGALDAHTPMYDAVAGERLRGQSNIAQLSDSFKPAVTNGSGTYTHQEVTKPDGSIEVTIYRNGVAAG